MDFSKYEWILLFIIITGLAIKLFFFYRIRRKKFKMFFRSITQWYDLSHNLEDIDEKVEAFLKISNYCNLLIWIGTGVLSYLIAFKLIFPD